MIRWSIVWLLVAIKITTQSTIGVTKRYELSHRRVFTVASAAVLVQDAGGSELPQLIRLLPAVALHSCKMDGAIVTARCAHHVTAE
jgi:hypothetical protein